MSESTFLFSMLNDDIQSVATHAANTYWDGVSWNDLQSLLENAKSFSELAFLADVNECQALDLVASFLQAALRLGKSQFHSTSVAC